MSEDRTGPAPAESDDKPSRTLLERIGQALVGEPRDREEVLDLVRDAHKREIIDPDALTMIEGTLSVADMQVRDIMIPRSQMVVVERESSPETFLPVIIESAHSRFPVIGENRDEVIGILLAKDLLQYLRDGSSHFDLREILRPAVFIPESKRLNVLLREFRQSRNHMAIVVDEYGGVAGLVTIEDVLEQIVGEIEDEHDIDDDVFVLQHNDNTFTVKALTPIDDFNDYFGSEFPDEEFDTIGGLVMQGFGHVPKRGEELDLGGFRFKLLRSDNRRIYLMQVRRLSEEELAAQQVEGEPLREETD
ncbi:MAG: CBS domain-containing protein [Gammaproteobacteria bacterium]|nr:CBS domain-containing protein [Gammaproteobacteria bacterium]